MGAEFKRGKDPMPGVREAVRNGVQLAAEQVLGESRRLVPIEEATLERSGAASVEDTGEGVRGVVSYDTPYQVRCTTARRADMGTRRWEDREVPRATTNHEWPQAPARPRCRRGPQRTQIGMHP